MFATVVLGIVCLRKQGLDPVIKGPCWWPTTCWWWTRVALSKISLPGHGSSVGCQHLSFHPSYGYIIHSWFLVENYIKHPPLATEKASSAFWYGHPGVPVRLMGEQQPWSYLREAGAQGRQIEGETSTNCTSSKPYRIAIICRAKKPKKSQHCIDYPRPTFGVGLYFPPLSPQ